LSLYHNQISEIPKWLKDMKIRHLQY